MLGYPIALVFVFSPDLGRSLFVWAAAVVLVLAIAYGREFWGSLSRSPSFGRL